MKAKIQILKKLKEALNYDYIKAQSLAKDIQDDIKKLYVYSYNRERISEINDHLQYAYKAMSLIEVKEHINNAIEQLESLEVLSKHFYLDEYDSLNLIIHLLEDQILTECENFTRRNKENPLENEVQELISDVKKVLEKSKLLENKMKNYE